MDDYNNLPIYSKDDISISVIEICEILKVEPGKLVGDIMSDLEYKILTNEMKNKKEELKDYVINKYGGDKNEK